MPKGVYQRKAQSKRKTHPFCKYGHEIAVCGRNKSGQCLACRVNNRLTYNALQRAQYKIRYKRKSWQFCNYGHDTWIVGRGKPKRNDKFGRCKSCIKATSRKYYLEKREQVGERNLAWRAQHIEQYKAIQRRAVLRRRVIHKERIKAQQREGYHRRIVNLTDTYVKQLLVQILDIPRVSIPGSVIELKRQQLVGFRLLKQYNKEQRV